MDDDLLLDEQPRRRRWLALFGSGGRLRRYALRGFLVLVVLALLYYPVGAFWVHRIDDDTDFGPGEVAPGASRSVAVTAALIDREVGQHAWPANDPWFLPGYALDNMPNYQLGIVAALSRFTVELTDQIGRSRGSSRADPDLDKAGGLLKYPGNVWIWDPSVSLWPTATSEQQYLGARDALFAYNRRLAAGNAVFERRADNLINTLARISADLGSASAVLEQRIETNSGGFIDFQADDIFYNTKGRLYAYALLLRELGTDFAQVINEKDAQAVWQQMLDNMFIAARMQPWVVVNGAPDGQFQPSHLAAQGFFLLRARTQLGEISDVLLK
jgi:hypothetical protein